MKLNFFAGIEYKNQIFFSDYNKFNGLFRYDIESQEVRFVQLFEKEALRHQLHRAAFLYKNEAWFIPQEASYIANINLDTMDITYYKIPDHKERENKETGHYCSYIKGRVVQGRYIYLIPYDIDVVLVIDMELHELYPYYDVINLEEEVMADGVLIKDNLFLFPASGKFCIKLNLRTNERERIEWRYGEWAFGSVQRVDNKIWFAPISENYLLAIELGNGKIHQLPLPNPEDQYWDMMAVGNELIFFPYQAANFLSVNMNTMEIKINRMKENEHIFFKNPNIVSRIESKNKNIVTMGLLGNVVFFDKKNTIASLEIDPKCFFSQLGEYRKRKVSGKELLTEEDIAILADIAKIDKSTVYNNLEDFYGLKIILSELPYSDKFQNDSENIGKTIWNRISENESVYARQENR